ncbi:hypothetical protein [uncultured Roseobacter sp.]|uniref:hypothetical protein n=1 Tax=uncultured Roseobacter sp. TaxID=114847 RepID=UPI0026132DB4|nr:hypothetical protein [uncultured Roseobacter sp.]
MERGPDHSPQQSPERVKPAFDRVSDPEQARKADIELKAERIAMKAKAMERTYTNLAQRKHAGTAYTAKEIQSLEQYAFTPPGIAKPLRLPGALKSPTDVHKLANLDARAKILARQSQIIDAAKNMKDIGKSVSNGRITQTRRGLDTAPIKLDKPLNTSLLKPAFGKAMR